MPFCFDTVNVASPVTECLLAYSLRQLASLSLLSQKGPLCYYNALVVTNLCVV